MPAVPNVEPLAVARAQLSGRKVLYEVFKITVLRPQCLQKKTRSRIESAARYYRWLRSAQHHFGGHYLIASSVCSLAFVRRAPRAVVLDCYFKQL